MENWNARTFYVAILMSAYTVFITVWLAFSVVTWTLEAFAASPDWEYLLRTLLPFWAFHAVVCAIITGLMAKGRFRRVWLWVLLAVLLWVFAPVILALLGNGEVRLQRGR